MNVIALYKVNKIIYLLYIYFFPITLLDLTSYNDEPKPE